MKFSLLNVLQEKLSIFLSSKHSLYAFMNTNSRNLLFLWEILYPCLLKGGKRGEVLYLFPREKGRIFLFFIFFKKRRNLFYPFYTRDRFIPNTNENILSFNIYWFNLKTCDKCGGQISTVASFVGQISTVASCTEVLSYVAYD